MSRSRVTPRITGALLTLLFVAAPDAYAWQDTEIEVGDFAVRRSVDFLTDEVSYLWARTGDPIPFSDEGSSSYERFLQALERVDNPVPAYETLELRCVSGGLRLSVRFSDGRPALGPTVGDRTRVVQTNGTTPTQWQFDSNPPRGPADWVRSEDATSATERVVLPSDLVHWTFRQSI